MNGILYGARSWLLVAMETHTFAEKGRRSTGRARLCFVEQLDLGCLLTALNTLISPACQSLGAAGVTDSATWQADYTG